jgi:protein-disulfide isomerase/uncharacterized membrane protein YphA (DoxX/SURF4 family)
VIEPALVLARTTLALVFGTAGLTKLADRPGSRQAMVRFGVPEQLAGPLALALPVGELVVAAALIPASTARPAAFAAATLLLIFLGAVTHQLAHGRHPDCHCFGRLYSKPIGPPTVIRNAVLLALAILVSIYPAPLWASAFAWVGLIDVREALVLGVILLLAAVVAGQGWMLLNLARQQGRLMLRLDAVEGQSNAQAEQPRREGGDRPAGLPLGTTAPAFELPSLEGGRVSLDELCASGHPVLLVSIDPECGPCASLLPDIAGWQKSADALTVAILSRGSAKANRRKLEHHGISRVLLQQDQEVAEKFKATATPSAVLISSDGKIAAMLAAGADDIRGLVERTIHPPRRRGGLPVGSSAPVASLPDLDGMPFDLRSRLEQPTVLLFWNPRCGFCERMLPELRAWELERPDETGLVVISSGSVELNREMGLRSTVLREDDFYLARQYGATGTPSAVLIESGRVSGQPSVGSQAVLELLRRMPTAPVSAVRSFSG